MSNISDYNINPWVSAGIIKRTPKTKRYVRHMRMRPMTNEEIRKQIAEAYGIDISKVQIDTNRTSTPGNYIVTVMWHPKPKLKIGSKTFVIS